MAKVDIIIPAYNAARYLSIAIESVLNQTFDDWRILVINDGSLDNTAEVVEAWASRLGPRLISLYKSNGGVSSARNLGIRNATAEYVAMLDADDVWLPCRLSESLRAFDSRPNAGLAYGFIHRIDAAGKLVDTFDRRQRHAEGHIAPYIYMKEVDIPCVTVTIRRSCLDAVGLFDETLKVTEDRDLWFRLASKYEVALVPVVIANYRMSSESITSVPDRMLRSQLQFIEKNYGSAGCGWLARRVALGRAYKQRADQLGPRHGRAALLSALKAVLFNPFDSRNVRTAGSLLLHCTGLRG